MTAPRVSAPAFRSRLASDGYLPPARQLIAVAGVAFWLVALAPVAPAQGGKKPKIDFTAGMSDELRSEIESQPPGVQIYIQQRLAGGTGQGLLDPVLSQAWKVGQVGIISYGPSNLAPEKQVFAVNNVVDGRNAIINDHTIWVEGLTTDNVVDGGTVDLQGHVFVVAGNKTYRTALGGNRTVKHVVAVNTRAMNNLIGKIVEPHGYRVWSDTAGVTDIAKFRRKSGGSITLEYLNGRNGSIPFKKLGPVDQEWVNAHAESPKE